MPGSCQHCGAQLALGAVACFRCGRLVARLDEDGGTGASVVLSPTNLGTIAKSELLENQWRLVKLLGQGAVGQVWQAHDVALDRPVAVKLMHEALAADPGQVARFEREGRLLASMDHPGLLSVLGIGRVQGRPFLVTHLLEGKTLAEHLHQRGGKLDPKEAARVFAAVCDALSCLHSAQVVHRDVKPSNIFVGDDGHVTLLDLGSALESGSELTRTAPLALTSPYLSPEQRAGGALDGKADVYALGCLLLEVLTPEAAPIELKELCALSMAPAAADRPSAAEFRAILAPHLPVEVVAPAVILAPVAVESDPVTAPTAPLESEQVTGPSPAPVKFVPLMDEPEVDQARTYLRPALAPAQRRITRKHVKYVLAAGGVAALLAVLFAPKPAPAPLPVATPLEKLAFIPLRSAPEAPRATPDLLERKDDFIKRADEAAQAARERRMPGKRPAPAIRRQILSYFGAREHGELQIEVLLDGKPVSANLSIDSRPLGPSPVYLPLKPGVHRVGVERRPFPPIEFPIAIQLNKTVRLEVELKPLEGAL